MNDLDVLTPDDARAFFKRWYTPPNAVVIVAGDVDVKQVRQWAQKYYGGIAARPVPVRKPRLEPPQVGKRTLELKAPAEQAYVAMAFRVPGLQSSELAKPENQDALALTVLAAVLDGYSGARLDRALTQGPNRVADGAGASNGLMGRGPMLFVLDGVPAKDKTAAQVEAALREQIARVAREGVSEAELARVKTQWVASEVYKLDSVFNQARELGNYWVQGLPLNTSERLITQLRQVTSEQVQQVAAKYFGDDQLTVGVLLPQPLDSNRAPRAAPVGTRH
jgi:zinc protease